MLNAIKIIPLHQNNILSSKSMQKPLFIEQLNAHELSAFEMLYKQYYKALTLFAYNFVGNQSEAEDIVQDVIVAIWLREDTFENIKSFEAYIYNAVKFKSLNILKRKNIAQRYIDEQTIKETLPSESHSSIEELYIALFKAIDTLPKRCKEVLLLGMEGKSNAEIAEQLNLSVETIKTHRKRALGILRETLKDSPELAMIMLLFILPSIHNISEQVL